MAQCGCAAAFAAAWKASSRSYSDRMRYALCAAALLVGCASAQKPPPEAAKAEAASARVQFIENDLPGALARARAEGKPLFVDTWAPW